MRSGQSSAQHKTPIAQGFNPKNIDTDQWVLMAKSLGTTVAVLVVKHELGFCLWQSEANPYCLKASPWRAGHDDILRDFVESCRKHGLKPGVFTEARVDARLGIDNFNPLQGPLSPGRSTAACWSRNPRGIKSLKMLQECYLNSVGHNTTLVIGLLPNQDYAIPAPDAARCAEFGR